MNKYLITWYGITDLKASMGLEKQGPILAALLTGDYSHVKILGFTKSKNIQEKQSEFRTLLIREIKDKGLKEKNVSNEESFKYVDLLANTADGHEFYLSWLRERLLAENISMETELSYVFLDSLNDFRGIYSAATNALNEIAEKENYNHYEATLFLSPGTPVMAFSWAFLAIANSDKNIKVIVSPDMRKAPESVNIPSDLIEYGMKIPNKEKLEDFDVIFHLMGEQTIPVALGILQFKSKTHVFVTSQEYSVKRFNKILPSDCSEPPKIIIDPFDPQSAKIEILKIAKRNPDWRRIGFNLTGGTKLMFAGAISACHSLHGIPFYFETEKHRLIWLNTFEKNEIKSLNKVETFLDLNENVQIVKRGIWEENEDREVRVPLTKQIWMHRSYLADLYKKLSLFSDCPGKPFCIQNRYISCSLNEENLASITIGGQTYSYIYWPDFAKYLCGGWLEEFTFLQLRPLLKIGIITDLRIGLEIEWKNSDKLLAQELDIVIVNGKQMMILECKAGKVFAEDIAKLQNNIGNYGGIEALGALIAAFDPNQAVRKRIESNPRIALFVGEAIVNRLPNKVFNFNGKGIYT